MQIMEVKGINSESKGGGQEDVDCGVGSVYIVSDRLHVESLHVWIGTNT